MYAVAQKSASEEEYLITDLSRVAPKNIVKNTI